jgi:general secretion pathway protein D
LKIFVEISSVVPGTRNAENGLTTNVRTTETSVVVKNNQMVVTGGLLSDSTIEQEQGVPLLMEIPVLGKLFKSKSETVQQTNLLILITPRIVNDDISAQMATDYYGSRLPKSLENARKILSSPMVGQLEEEEEEKPFIEEDVVDDLDF